MAGLFPSVSEDNKGDLMDGSSVSCSVYPTSPRINSGLSRLGGGGPYSSFNRHMLASKIASLGDGTARGLFTNEAAAAEDANSVELQHLFYGNSKFNILIYSKDRNIDMTGNVILSKVALLKVFGTFRI